MARLASGQRGGSGWGVTRFGGCVESTEAAGWFRDVGAGREKRLKEGKKEISLQRE
jgi:hypothetical protein